MMAGELHMANGEQFSPLISDIEEKGSEHMANGKQFSPLISDVEEKGSEHMANGKQFSPLISDVEEKGSEHMANGKQFSPLISDVEEKGSEHMANGKQFSPLISDVEEKGSEHTANGKQFSPLISDVEEKGSEHMANGKQFSPLISDVEEKGSEHMANGKQFSPLISDVEEKGSEHMANGKQFSPLISDVEEKGSEHMANGEQFSPLISDVEEKGSEHKADESVKDKSKRLNWKRKCEYVLSVVGYCVGLGNLWRFPYLVNRNGGGAFLIPFVICLVLFGLPLFFLESVLGQSTRRGVIQVWEICPLAKGIGFTMNVLNLLAYFYYMTVMAWAFYYLVVSFQSVVPWSICTGWWNTPNCTTISDTYNKSLFTDNTSSEISVTAARNYSVGFHLENVINVTGETEIRNVTDVAGSQIKGRYTSSAEEFWQHNVLQVSQGLEHPGHVVWYLAVALLAAHLLCFLSLIKGIRSSGKVVYVTATAPYLLITVLLVRGVMLPGALDGIVYYLMPEFSRLANAQVWIEAALHVFYSLCLTWGGIMTMASYNKYHNNCYRDTIILTFVCEGTSFFAGFAVFSIMGYMAHTSGVHVSEVVSSGPGLAFIAYPQAISLMPVPQLWAALFFIMLIMLGVDTEITGAEVILTSLCDHFPRIMGRYRSQITALFCTLSFIFGLSCITQGGIFVFQLIDWFIATITNLIIGIIECVIVGWVYDGISGDIRMMLGREPPRFMTVLWRYVTPVLLLVLFVVTLIKYEVPTYGDYHYSTLGHVFGWSLATVPFLPIPAVAIYQLWRANGSFLQRLRQTTLPNKSCGQHDFEQAQKSQLNATKL